MLSIGYKEDSSMKTIKKQCPAIMHESWAFAFYGISMLIQLQELR